MSQNIEIIQASKGHSQTEESMDKLRHRKNLSKWGGTHRLESMDRQISQDMERV
jgi:hypothetical protein